jgi:hypothetical protein
MVSLGSKKPTGEDPDPLMPEEVEKAIREMPRDAEVIELLKKLQRLHMAAHRSIGKIPAVFLSAA